MTERPRSKAKSGHQTKKQGAVKQARKRKQLSKFKNAELRATLDSQVPALYLSQVNQLQGTAKMSKNDQGPRELVLDLADSFCTL